MIYKKISELFQSRGFMVEVRPKDTFQIEASRGLLTFRIRVVPKGSGMVGKIAHYLNAKVPVILAVDEGNDLVRFCHIADTERLGKFFSLPKEEWDEEFGPIENVSDWVNGLVNWLESPDSSPQEEQETSEAPSGNTTPFTPQ